MKKRIVSILLMAMMVLGTFSISVFAFEDAPTADPTVVPEATEVEPTTDGEPAPEAVTPETTQEEQGTEVNEEPKEEVAEDLTLETQTSSEPLATPANLVAYSAFYSVALEWDPVADAASYDVFVDGVPVANVPTSSTAYDNPGKMAYVVGGLAEEGVYTFNVQAKKAPDDADHEDSALSNAYVNGPVRQMYIWIKFKSKAKLKSHDAAKVKHTFQKGEWVRAHGFGGGKYRFYYGGNLFYTSFLRTKSAWADYTRNFDYDRKSAEYFINTSGTGSATGWYLWVNQFTQHVYLFTGSAGNWRVYGDWTCSTGAPKTPSPTGFGKKIYKRVKKRNGHGPWTAFQSWTSFHGTKKSWMKNWDTPVSHACIRCPNEWAQFIYHNLPNGTAVAVY